MEFLRQNKAAAVFISGALLVLGVLVAVFVINVSNEVTLVAQRDVPAPVAGAPSVVDPGTEISDPDEFVLPEYPAEPELILQPKNPDDDIMTIQMCVHQDGVYAGSAECIPSASVPSTPAESAQPTYMMIDVDLSDAEIFRALTGTIYTWTETATQPELTAIEISSKGYLAVIRKAGLDEQNVVDIRLSRMAAESLGFVGSTPTSEFTLVVGR